MGRNGGRSACCWESTFYFQLLLLKVFSCAGSTLTNDVRCSERWVRKTAVSRIREAAAGCGLKEETWAQGLDLMVSNLATTVSLEAWRWVTVMGRKQQLNVGYHVILASTQWPQFLTPTPLHSWMYLWWLHIKLDAGFGIHCSLKF